MKERKSLFGFNWRLQEMDALKALGFRQKFGLESAVADVLAARHDVSYENLEAFLTPSIRGLMPNPFDAMLDVKAAAERIVRAIKARENVVIFGDYDVDGACSSALLKRFFRMVGLSSQIYIPDRIKEGYGPNTNALLKLRREGADLVITVDCGTVAFEPLKEAHAAGLDIVVVDHHKGAKEKPHSIAIINPNRFDETSDYGYLCGVGVCFFVAVAVNMMLKEEGYYAKNGLKEPSLITLVDLVALGTICDVMPLIGLNRAFVRTGLEVLKAKGNEGLAALLEVAGVDGEITEYTLGFVLGPRINAGGRIGRADLGSRLLSSCVRNEVEEIAKELHELNAKRKEMEEEMLYEAFIKIESEGLYEKPIVCVASEQYHSGIIGILAARIKEKYHKPSCVVAVNEEGVGKASLRSTPQVDIGAIIHEACAKGLLIAGGGHFMAGGFSAESAKLQAVFDFFANAVELMSAGTTQRELLLSSKLSVGGASLELFEQLKKMAPFGNANPKPIFMFENAALIKVDVLKERHLSMLLKCEHTGKTLKTMLFNALNLGVLETMVKMKGKKIDVAGELSLNEWLGQKTVQLNFIDARI